MKAIGKNVIIAREPRREKTDGGIYLPETARKHEVVGRVLHAGAEAVHVKEGNEVLYSTVSERVVGSGDGRELVLVSQDAILVILKD